MTIKTRRVWVVLTPKGNPLSTHTRMGKTRWDVYDEFLFGKGYRFVRAELRYPVFAKGGRQGRKGKEK